MKADLVLCFTVPSNSGVDQVDYVGIKLNSRAHFWSTCNVPHGNSHSVLGIRLGMVSLNLWDGYSVLGTHSSALQTFHCTAQWHKHYPPMNSIDQKTKESISLCFNLKILQGERAKGTQQKTEARGESVQLPVTGRSSVFTVQLPVLLREHYKHPH